MHSSGSTIVAWPSLREWRGRMLGLPFVIAACSPGAAFGWDVCVGAGVLAILSNFVVFVPLTVLALNGGRAVQDNLHVPPLTPLAYLALLLLWTTTIWIAAAALSR